MNIYSFEYSRFKGCIDWVIAQTKSQAREVLKSENGLDNCDLEGVEITRLSKKEREEFDLLDTNEYFPDQEDNEEYFSGYKIVSTFQEEMDSNPTPRLLASTDI